MPAAEDYAPAMILRTKLHRPRISSDLVARQRLLELMEVAEHAPLTLVSAPAGYGKSVFVGQWAEQCDSPVAWLSLDSDDSELRTFLAYFLAALDSVSPGAFYTTSELLVSPALPPTAVVVNFLVNDLDDMGTPCSIVLDDYHRIEGDSPVHDLMTTVLEHPPPQIRFVLVSRRDPPLALAKMRADGRMNEVRLQDLRFTATETVELLAAAVEGVISEAALTNLGQQVEGWAVGLRLATLALRHAGDPDVFLKGMHGGLPNTRAYLMHEVLGALSPEVSTALLSSSILDRFCEPLLAAIRDPSTATAPPELSPRAFIQELRRSNLFAIPLDHQGRWFRYHHLFQDLLAAELRRVCGADHVAALHIRASEWLEGEGLIEEALKQALAAEDLARAAQIVERNRQGALDLDQWYLLDKWLTRLPETVVQQYPELLMARAWVFIHHFRFEAVFPILDEIEALLDDDPAHESLRGEVALHRGYILYFLGEGAGSLKYMGQALEWIPESFSEARAQSEVIFALASQMEGRQEQALGGLDDLLLVYDSPNEVRKTRLVITYVFIHFLSGDLAAAEAANRQLRVVAERSRYEYALAWSDYLQGLIHLSRYELDAAAEHLGRSVSQRFIHFQRAAADSITALMLAQQAGGRSKEAGETLQLLREYVSLLKEPTMGALVSSSEARLAVMQERPEPADRLLESNEIQGGEAMLWWLDVPATTYCRALISHGSTASLEQAAKGLRESAKIADAHHNTYQLIGVLVLQAVVREKQGRADEAAAALLRAVSLAEPGGFIFPFVEPGQVVASMLGRLTDQAGHQPFIRHLLAAFDDHHVPTVEAPSTPPGEPSTTTGPEASPTTGDSALDALTNREMDILELLADRLQNKEIAARLCISMHTVNDHLKHIYQKLAVKGRRQAVKRAAEIGLISR